MVREHGRRIYRDILTFRPLTVDEWRLVEADLRRRLEADGW